MKLARKNKWLVFSVLAVPLLFWSERRLRVLILLGGTWQIESNGSDRSYLKFYADGTGEQLSEWRGKGKSRSPFYYKFSGLSELKVVRGPDERFGENPAFCGTRLLHMCTHPEQGSAVVFLSFGLDGNIYMANPKAEKPYFTWRRVTVEPLP